jgi:hypothetical protein
MFSARNLKERLEARPFRPFWVCLSNGSAHEVPHPELGWVVGNRIFVATPVGEPPGGDYSVRELSVLHISRLDHAPGLPAGAA